MPGLAMIWAAGARRVFRILGAALILAAVMQASGVLALLNHGTRVRGVVEAAGFGGRHPEIRYPGPGGQRYWIVGGGVFAPVTENDVVQIIYTPSDPVNTARIDTVASLWAAVLLLAGLGMALLLTATLVAD